MASNAGSEDEWADLFLSAALEPHLWDNLLTAMAAATGSGHGQLIGFDTNGAMFNWISDIDQSIVQRTKALKLHRPDVNFRIAADALPHGADIVHEAHYDIARQTVNDDDYLDLCADFDIFDGCHTRLVAEEDMMVGLALLRKRKDGRTTQDQRDLFARIAQHARAGVSLQRAVEQQGFALLSGSLEVMGRPCWLLDGAGRVRGMTPQAETLLQRDRVRVSDGWLSSARPDETRAILHGVRAVVDRPARPASSVIVAQVDGSAMLLEFHPLPNRPWAMSFAPHALVVARDARPGGHQARMLLENYQLTSAEADIAVRLASGMSRQHIAAARGVSAETLKAQLRSIYEKTGCSRESQLVRLVAMLGT